MGVGEGCSPVDVASRLPLRCEFLLVRSGTFYNDEIRGTTLKLTNIKPQQAIHAICKPRVPLAMALGALGCLAATTAMADALSDEVVVTASRLAEPLDQVLGSVSVINRADIEQAMASDVAGLLEQLGTVDVIHNGGPGQTESIFLRGANSNQTLVMMDGVRLNPATIGVASIQNISPEIINSIEVVRGPRSALYGSDAIGGVINILTRSPAGTGLDLSADTATYQTRDVTLTGYTGFDQTNLLGSFHRETSDGFPTQVGDPTNRGYNNDTFFVKASTAHDGLSANAEAWHASGTVDYSNLYSTPIDQRQQFNDSRYSVSFAGSLVPTTHSTLMISQLTDNLTQLTSADYETTHRTQIDFSTDALWGAHRVIAGAQLNFENARSSVYGTNFDVNSVLHTFYAEDRYHQGIYEGVASVGFTHSDAFGDHVTWNAGGGLHVTDGGLVSLTAGSAFRAPDSTDLYGFGGNVALKPETSNNVELTYRQNTTDLGQFEVTAYDHRISDLITYTYMPTPDNPYNGMNENVDRAHIKGVEGRYTLNVESWHYEINGERQEALDLSNGGSLLRRAHAMGSLIVAHRCGDWNFQGDWRVVGVRDDIDANTYLNTLNPGYALLGLGAQWHATTNLSLQARIDNLTNRAYQTANGYLSPGRVIKVGFRYSVAQH